MFFTTTIVHMIDPTTEGGKQLKERYDAKIKSIEEDTTTAFDRSGPRSRHAQMQDLMTKYNSLLAEIEDVPLETIQESQRPQMVIPTTDGGRQLKETYDTKIKTIEEDTTTAFDRSGPGSKWEKVNQLRLDYNRLLNEIEGKK